MPDRDLKLNSLSRYSKESPRFILEEYSHCEVPAGCGGVVLRWRDPDDGLPILVRLYAAGECRAYLDGAPLAEGRPTVAFGEHLLAFEISAIDPRYLVLVFAAVYDDDEPGRVRRSRPTGARARILSAPDGTWKYTTRPPDGSRWTGLELDDSKWPAMIRRDERRPPADPERDTDRWRIEWIVRDGAVPLGIYAAADRIWVRKRFAIHRAGEAADE